MKRLNGIMLLLLVILTAQAQMVNPVHFKSELKTGNGAEAEIVFTATIDPGWHVYSTDLGQDGPIEATFNVVKMEGVETVGRLTPRGNVIKKFDEMFGMELKFFEKSATFVQKVKFTKPQYTIDCFLEYGACNDQNCMPPTQVELKKTGTSPSLSKEETVGAQNSVDTPQQEEPPLPSNEADSTAASHPLFRRVLGRLSGHPSSTSCVLSARATLSPTTRCSTSCSWVLSAVCWPSVCPASGPSSP